MLDNFSGNFDNPYCINMGYSHADQADPDLNWVSSRFEEIAFTFTKWLTLP